MMNDRQRRSRYRRYRRRKSFFSFLRFLMTVAVLVLVYRYVPLNLNYPDPVPYVRDFVKEKIAEFQIGKTETGKTETGKTMPGQRKEAGTGAGETGTGDTGGNGTGTKEQAGNNSTALPASYDLRDYGKVPAARSQGDLGTCWAFSRLSAIESARLPKNTTVLSPDHMSIHSPGVVSQNDGGDINTADAYLLSWAGPVKESDDPYGDGYSPDNLSAVCHVQEIRMLGEKNYDAIKRAVMQYGGVVSSICIPTDNDADSEFYNREAAAFCYNGSMEDNHDAVIIGWDDSYPASNFHSFAKNDGAFLVLSSWGDKFGDKGVFHVSYDDQFIGQRGEVYTKVENPDNYDHIYQSDLSGETATMGFDHPFIRFANVFRADRDENIVAAGFYATGTDTSVEFYTAVKIGERSPWFWKPVPAAKRTFSEEGYYTVPFDAPVPVDADSRFAVLACVKTKGSSQPVAIEYSGENGEYKVNVKDGEGYISCLGSKWYSAEKDYNCNVCLKAYTKNR